MTSLFIIELQSNNLLAFNNLNHLFPEITPLVPYSTFTVFHTVSFCVSGSGKSLNQFPDGIAFVVNYISFVVCLKGRYKGRLPE